MSLILEFNKGVKPDIGWDWVEGNRYKEWNEIDVTGNTTRSLYFLNGDRVPKVCKTDLYDKGVYRRNRVLGVEEI